MKKRFLSMALAVVMLFSLAAPVGAAGAEGEADEALMAAEALYELGLFQGVGVQEDGTPDFDLEGVPTRAQAITMLVRLLGKEGEAKAGTWTTPFTDLADWQVPYVGYAYANGLTLGNGDGTFGGDQPTNAAQYITFVLRALKYDDQAGDFAWDKPWELSDEIGLTDGRYGVNTASFLRGDVAIISAGALGCALNGGTEILLFHLYENGVLDGVLNDEEKVMMELSSKVMSAVQLETKGTELCGQALEAENPADGLALTLDAQKRFVQADEAVQAAVAACGGREKLAGIKTALEGVLSVHAALSEFGEITAENYSEYASGAVLLSLDSMGYYMQMLNALQAVGVNF